MISFDIQKNTNKMLQTKTTVLTLIPYVTIFHIKRRKDKSQHKNKKKNRRWEDCVKDVTLRKAAHDRQNWLNLLISSLKQNHNFSTSCKLGECRFTRLYAYFFFFSPERVYYIHKTVCLRVFHCVKSPRMYAGVWVWVVSVQVGTWDVFLFHNKS